MSSSTKYVTGYCPHQEDEATVEIKYREFNTIGVRHTQFKKIFKNCDCSTIDSCEHTYTGAPQCPILANAPDRP